MEGWQMIVVVAGVTIALLVLGIRALLRGRRVPPKAKLALAAAFRAWITLAVTAALQAVVLGIRIRVEERALTPERT